MRVEVAKQATSGNTGATPRDATPAPVDSDTASRALVVTAPAPVPGPAIAYRQAAFLAHLIAVKDQHPQTRERRRADPADAIAAYRTVAAMTRH